MTLTGKVICRLVRLYQRLLSIYYMRRFICLERPVLKQLQVGLGTTCAVPVRSDGKGSLKIGVKNLFGYRSSPLVGNGEILLQPRSPEAEIIIGDGNIFNNNLTIVANERIVVGDSCRFGDQVAIYDCDFHEINPASRNRSPGLAQPVVIGNNVWLGSRVIVLKGVTIGDNSVIGAMSLVTRALPANVIAGGVPARIIRKIE